MAYKKGNYETFSKKEVRKLTEDMKDKLTKFIKEGNYKNILASCVNSIYRFSSQNQIWLLGQAMERGEKLEMLKTFKGWKKLGFQVQKGEKSYTILKPVFTTYKKYYEERLKQAQDSGVSEDIEKYQKLLNEIESGEREDKALTRYRKDFEFEVSQTDKTIDDYYKLFGIYQLDRNKVIENKDKIINGVLNKMKEINYQVYFDQEMEGTEKGFCSPVERKICIKSGSDLQVVKTLCHEAGHALAHTDPRDDFKDLNEEEITSIRECEAESIACIVCSHLGLDTTNYSFSYITGWSGNNINKFLNSLGVISAYSSELIDSIDKELGINQTNNEEQSKDVKTYVEKEGELKEIDVKENGDSEEEQEM